MYEQEDLASEKYDRLLNIAVWANSLVWVIIIWFFIAGMVVFCQNLLTAQYGDYPQTSRLFLIAKSMFDLLSSLMKGCIYALLLRGISLGLKMLVETDINYRDKVEGGGAE